MDYKQLSSLNNVTPFPAPTKDVHIPVPGACEYVVTQQGGIEVVDGIKVANHLALNWGD